MIDFSDVSLTYPDADAPTLRHVDLHIEEGEFALVAGPTGVGKSTLLGAMNGHVPHFTGGRLQGRVAVAGLATADHAPRDLAETVGQVRQDPASGFVTDTVEEELAYGLEQLGVAPPVMRTRVEETLDLLGLASLRHRSLPSLSGGQQQRVAIGAVLATGARVLVLDEPTSALDPTSSEEVLAALLRLVHDVGVTVVVAEHRLERVVEYADRLVLLTGDGRVESGPVADLIERSPLRPPVVRLAEMEGWRPPPLSVRDARRRAEPLRRRLAGLDPDHFDAHPPLVALGAENLNFESSFLDARGGLAFGRAREVPDRSEAEGGHFAGRLAVSESTPDAASVDADHVDADRPGGLTAQGLSVAYGQTVALRDVSLSLPGGQITTLLGRNGSGKSSLLWALTGVGPLSAGRWAVDGQDLTGASLTAIRARIRLVPQTASDLLYLDSVAAECAAADQADRLPSGSARRLLDRLAPGIADAAGPRDLSEGQRLSLVLALQLAADPPVLLLDEPTRGLDELAKARLGDLLREAAARGRAIAVATHDVEFAAAVADRVAVLATGDLIASGRPGEILAGSAALAPQVAKVLAPQPWLTVAHVAATRCATGGAT